MGVALNERKKESYKIFDEIAHTYDLLNRILSGGIDVYWRSRLLKRLPKSNNIKALDLATGTGDMAVSLARHPRISQVIGLDMSEQMLQVGRRKSARKGLSEVIKMVEGDACEINYPDNTFDLVTITYGIRNFKSPLCSLKEIHRVLTPGGRLLIEEFGLPKNRIVKSFYLFYFRKVLPFIGNIISNHKDAYSYLNQTVEEFPYDQDFNQWMREAGFKTPKASPMTFGVSYLYEGDKE